ncbi:MAG TPA: 3-oxoacyl-ACP reductase FabG [Myxococcota bacterium]|jgi:3-oxoacyl-[acyl-carrier protein] reductase|nr:3-oxoacyl-ACP reductase FabG [Myxococcota bacterium]
MKLAGRVAFITGGGSGLGRAIAAAFAKEGARVAVNDLVEPAAKETVSALPGPGHLALAGDVSDAARVAAMFAEVERAAGRLDVLVNNAGVDHVPGDGLDQLGSGGPQILKMGDDGWSRMLAIHLNGAFLCAREAVRRMLPAKSGSIINMSSIAGLGGLGTLHYSTAKAGLLGFTRSMARDLGRYNIRVNAICPGAIDTPMSRRIPEPMIKGLLALTPLGRVGRPEDIAAAALYLASDDAAYVTGQALSPNGGVHIA